MRDRLFLGLACALTVLTLALPLYPAGDGGAHLYYAEVLRSLWHHAPWATEHFFVKNPLPPYAFHSYSLALLLEFLPALWAEKILIAAYTLTFLFGFRYVTRSVNKTPTLPIEFAAFPLVTNVILRSGFYNCALGIATALFGWGWWLRHSGRWTKRSAAIALALTALVASMHPIALAGLLLVYGCDTLFRLIRWRTQNTKLPTADLALTATASLSLLWVLAFLAPGNNATPPLDLPLKLILFFGMWLFPPEASALGFLPFFLTVYPLSLFLRRNALSHPLSLAAAILFVIQLLAPFGTSVNGSLFLAHRFALLTVLALLPLAATSTSTSRWPAITLALATAISFANIPAQFQTANIYRPLTELQIPANYSTGAVVEETAIATPGVLLPPGYWYAAHLFRNNHAYLWNAPWLNQTFHVPGLKSPQPCQYLDPPFTLTCLKQSPQPIDFVVHFAPTTNVLPPWATQLGLTRVLHQSPHYAIYGKPTLPQ